MKRSTQMIHDLGKKCIFYAAEQTLRMPGRGWVNDLVLRDIDSEGRNMEVVSDFGYRDAKGVTWWARSGAIVNGASIPRFLWRVIGPPFTGRYRRAAVLHDANYSSKVHSRKKVDLMFLSAMKYSGVQWWRRRAMYFVVRMCGEVAWISAMPPQRAP